jgi:hypothetical protein
MDKLQSSGPSTNAGESYTRNLLIVQTTHIQGEADWLGVKQRIERDAPDIEVHAFSLPGVDDWTVLELDLTQWRADAAKS